MLRLDMACEEFVPLVALAALRKSTGEETCGVVTAMDLVMVQLDMSREKFVPLVPFAAFHI